MSLLCTTITPVHGCGLKYLQALPDKSVDAIVTDPVYDEPYPLDEMLRVCKGNVIVFCDPRMRPIRNGDEILHWVKTPSTKNTVKRCSRFVEEIHVYRQSAGAFNRLHWSCMTGVFQDTIIDPNGHPWQKPLSLMQKLIRIYTREEDFVVDPFAGSGTTLLACQDTGRSALGIENDNKYFRIMQRRLSSQS